MSDLSKIIFVSTDPTGSKTCQDKLNDAITNGVIDKGDIAILQDSMQLVYIANSGVKHSFPFSESKAPKTFDSLTDVDTSKLDIGELIAVKSTDGLYEPYVCGTNASGIKEVGKLVKNGDISDITTDVQTLETDVNTIKSNITTLTSGLNTANTNIATNTANITTLRTDLTTLEAKVKQSDWNQNDSTKWDYIKNRPIYVKDDGSKQRLDNGYLEEDVVIEKSVTIGTKDADATTGDKSFSVGTQNYVSGTGAFGSGYKVEAKGVASHAEGYGTKANSLYGHAEGRQTTTGGRSAHAEGEGVSVSGDYSHGEGQNNTIESGALYSHAEGYGNSVTGSGAHVEGLNNIGQGQAQHVFGRFNAPNSTDVEIVGGGTSASDRKNIRTLSSIGKETLADTLVVGRAPAADLEVATKKYVDDNIQNLDVSDTAVSGKYVSSVSEIDGKITVTRSDIPVQSIATGSTIGTISVDGTDVVVKDVPALKSAVDTNKSNIDILNGADTTPGSVAKAVKTAKESVETEIGTLSNLQTTNKSNLVLAINEVRTSIGAGTDGVVVVTKQATPDTGYQTTYNVTQGGSSVGKISTKDHEYTGATSATQVSVTVNNTTNTVSAELVDDGVSTSKIASKAVTAAKIADATITSTQIADDAIVTTKVSNGNITKAKLATAVQDTLDQVETNKTNIGTLSSLTTSNKTSIVKSINSLKTDLDTAKTDLAITLTSTPGTGDVLKTYTLKQGTTQIGTIEIAKDLVVSSGAVVENPTGQPAGKYLELTLNDSASTKIYINISDLVDAYTAQANAPIVQLAISGTNEISATIKDGSIGTTQLADNAITTTKIVDGNVTLAKLSTTIQTSLGKADSAVQTIATGTANGTIKVDGTDVVVKGLGSAAYTDSTAYDPKDSASTVKTELLGAATDAATAITINGVKKYATDLNTAMDTRVSAIEAGGGGGDVETAINALNVADTPVAGKYVSGVSETKGKISVTRTDFPSMSGSVTPTGTVDSTFTGTNVAYTPEGTVSTPTITVTPTTDSVTGIATVGTLASCTMPTFSASVANEVLSFSWTDGSYTDGTLPTKSTAQTFVTGATATSSAPTFTGTQANIKATGTVASTFTGTASTVNVSV